MKKLLIITIFSLIGLFTNAQSNAQYSKQEIQYVQYTDWQAENEHEWGSFFWLTTITTSPDESGYYYYYVYIYSNSLMATKTYGQYDKASTYIKDLNIAMYEKNNMGVVYNKVNVYLPYATCDYVDDYYVAWFYSYSNANSFQITYSKVSAFDYSMY